jgi:thiamine-phosphate pyrophosphorylase
VTFPRPAVCLVTRVRGREGSSERVALLDHLIAAARAGIDLIQVRERQLSDKDLLGFVRELIREVRPLATRVLVNDRTDIAVAAAADGVHLKGDAPPAADVRSIVPAGFVIGRSVHGVAEAEAAAAAGGCDYLLFGTVYRSASKPDDHPVAGIDGLTAVCRRVTLPVLAIGGITIERAPDVAAAGAAGIAAISLFSASTDVAGDVGALRHALTLPARHD